MAIPKEYQDICNLLLEATNQRRVNWFERSGSFVVKLPDFDFEIWNGIDDDDGSRFVAIGLRGSNKRGPMEDSFAVGDEDPEFAKLNELCNAARRHANRVYDKLNLMHRLLESGGPIGAGPGDPVGPERLREKV